MQALSRRHRVWLAMLQVVLLLAAIAMPATASTSSSLLTGEKWLAMLQSYNIVRGDDQGNLNLDKPITRAEMVVIMIRALNAEQDAKLFIGLNPFEDAKGHWADAEIAYAAINKYVKGDALGFRPDSYITYAEALTLLLRLLGKEPTTGEWPVNVLLVAGELDLVPPGVTAGTANAEAIRGLIFQSMAKALAETPDAEGKTFLQRYIDNQAPELTVSLPETSDSESLKVSGTVEGAASVTVNGEEVSVVNGAFSTEISLKYGDNTVSVVARDYANNRDTYTATVNRPFPVASLTIEGPSKVAPGAKASYTINALDNDGEAVSLDLVTVKVEGAIGTFDKKTSTLTASETPGVSGKITVSAGKVSQSVNVQVMGQSAAATGLRVASVATVAYTKPMTVTVQVVDAEGTLVTDDYNRPISLAVSGLAGASVTPATAYTSGGVATFTVRTSQMGEVSLNATSQGLASNSTTAVFGSTTRVRLTADPAELIIGSNNTSSRIKAELVDENGNVVKNDTGEPIVVKLSTTSDVGFITDEILTIGRGVTNATSSGDEGLFSVFGVEGGTSTITGTVTLGPTMTVDPVSVRAIVPTAGSGSKLQARASQVMLNSPGPATFTIRLVDAQGNYVPSGSYAFQLKIETSNGEDLVDGVPEGVTVELGDSGLNPVSDGIAENKDDDTTDVIARTTDGVAVVKVYYDKAGVVTVTPIPMGGTSTAYNHDGDEGSATSSNSFSPVADSITFVKPVGGVSLTVTSNVGANQEMGAMPNSTGSSVTLNVTLLDGPDGNWVPGSVKKVTLSRESTLDTDINTTPPTKLTATTTDGKASFVVKGLSNAGTDTYIVTVEDEDFEDEVTVTTQSEKLDTPIIAMTRGYVKEGSTIFPGATDRVGLDDDGLAIFLDSNAGDSPVQAKVYAEGSSSPIYTTGAIDLNDSDGLILVPKDELPAGTKRYAVSLRNGLGETKRSEYSASVLNVTYSSAITISSAKYDAKTKKLTISGSGFSSSSSSPDTVYTSKLSLEDLSTKATIDLTGADVTISSSSSVVLTLDSSMYGDLEDATFFGGSDIRLHAQEGWYEKYSGQQAEEDLDNKVTPGARAHYAVFDRSNKRLHVFGEGFSTGSLVWGEFDLIDTAGDEDDAFDLSRMSPTRRSDSELMFTLSSAAVDALEATDSYVVRVGEGFLKDSSALAPAAGNLPIYAKVSMSKMTYNKTDGVITITGTGFNFTGGDVTASKFYIVDMDDPEDIKLTLDATTAVTVDDSNTMTLTLSDEDETALETGEFDGLNVFLRAQEGWVDYEGREAAPVTGNTLQFPSL